MKKPRSLKNKNEVLISKILVFAKLGISFSHTESWEKHFVCDQLLVSNSYTVWIWPEEDSPRMPPADLPFNAMLFAYLPFNASETLTLYNIINATCTFTFQFFCNPSRYVNVINETCSYLSMLCYATGRFTFQCLCNPHITSTSSKLSQVTSWVLKSSHHTVTSGWTTCMKGKAQWTLSGAKLLLT